ncbi:MAG: hypothetical protein QNK33_03740 [Bacteroidales bacterium]|nr:hypothetical protein [Bacteroidales bacterium]
MQNYSKHSGFAVAIAWPQTYCKQPGTWYDSICGILGINKNNYYRAGHAASVLIDIETRKCHYFDFGRYHSIFQHGRVRSAETDHDLEIKTVPVISADGITIENIKEILSELQANPSCHGEGELHASYCRINFHSAFNKANLLQQQSPIPYGPFRYKGNNCSRFVNSTILAGEPGWKIRLRLMYLVPITPTPMNNVNSLENRIIFPKLLENEPFIPSRKLDNQLLRSTLPQPERNPKIPENSQWLSGEGAGSWFAINMQGPGLKVTRYSPGGDIECAHLYKSSDETFSELDNSFRITYPSNCKVVSLIQKERLIRFEMLPG